MTIMRRKAVLAVNANNRYTVLLYGVKGADWSHLPELLQDEIKAAWVRDKMPKSKIKKYFSLAGPAEVTKTHGSKAVAAMNGCIYIMNISGLDRGRRGRLDGQDHNRLFYAGY